MAKQKRVEEPGKVQLRPVASPVSTMVTPASVQPAAPTALPTPAAPPAGPNAQQQYAQAMTTYGGELAGFSPRLDVLNKGLHDAFDPMIERRNEQMTLEGQRLVLESQKTFASLVDSGEVSVDDNPWLLYGARQASGILAGDMWRRHLTTEFEKHLTANPGLDESEFDLWHQDLKAQHIQKHRMVDPFELQTFHRSAQNTKRDFDNRVASHAAEYRKETVERGFVIGVSTAVENTVSLIDTLNSSRGGYIGEQVDAEGRPHANISADFNEPILNDDDQEGIRHLDSAVQHQMSNLLTDLQKSAEAYAAVHGWTKANLRMGTELIGLLSDPATYHPAIEVAYQNLKGQGGALLRDTGTWQTLWNQSRDDRIAAKELLSNEDQSEITQWMINNPLASRGDFLLWASHNITTSPNTINSLRNNYPALRKEINDYDGQLSSEQLIDVQMLFETSDRFTFAEWSNSAVAAELAGTGDLGLTALVRSRGFYDKFATEYWGETSGLTTAGIKHIISWELKALQGEQVITTDQIEKMLMEPPLSMQVNSRELNSWLTQIANRLDPSKFGPATGMNGEEYVAFRLHFDQAAVRPTRQDVLDHINATTPHISEAQKKTSIEMIVQSFRSDTGTTVMNTFKDAAVTDIQGVIKAIKLGGNDYSTIIPHIRERYPDGFEYMGQRWAVDISTEGVVSIEGLSGHEKITVDLKKEWDKATQRDADSAYSEYTDVFDSLSRAMQAGDADAVQVILDQNPTIGTDLESAAGWKYANGADIILATGSVPQPIRDMTEGMPTRIGNYSSMQSTPEGTVLQTYTRLRDARVSEMDEGKRAEIGEALAEIMEENKDWLPYQIQTLEKFQQLRYLYVQTESKGVTDQVLDGDMLATLEVSHFIMTNPEFFPTIAGKTGTGDYGLMSANKALMDLDREAANSPLPPIEIWADSWDHPSDTVLIESGSNRQAVVDYAEYAGSRFSLGNERDRLNAVDKFVAERWSRLEIEGVGGAHVWVDNRIGDHRIVLQDRSDLPVTVIKHIEAQENTPAFVSPTVEEIITEFPQHLVEGTYSYKMIFPIGPPEHLEGVDLVIAPAQPSVNGQAPTTWEVTDSTGMIHVGYWHTQQVVEMWTNESELVKQETTKDTELSADWERKMRHIKEGPAVVPALAHLYPTSEQMAEKVVDDLKDGTLEKNDNKSFWRFSHYIKNLATDEDREEWKALLPEDTWKSLNK